MNPFGNHFRGMKNFTAGRRQKLGKLQQMRNYLLKEIGAYDVYGTFTQYAKKRV